ncbi:S8 family serine peptidase [Pseudomonas sp. S60]|uniref:S8 family peptidase n=1 Tax=Pseudomonas sp. S60 TaxID=211124 RepID=UPI001912104B|nr:S8 family serine peptidase [Pseudomonas sp. S60]MBK5010734.1 S8 family serine peptidase [Pseudomonas sp. S60]
MDKYIILKRPLSSASSMKRSVTETGSERPSLVTERLQHHEAAELGRDPEILAISRPMKTKLISPLNSAAEPEDAGDAWGVAAVNAHLSPYTGAGVRVAVLDTGIDRTHPAFAGVELQEQDFTGEGNGDWDGHGTHCAGTIFGRNVDGRRIGIARGVKNALIAKVIGEHNADSDILFQGMYWALAQRANIISMSLGFDFPGEVEEKINKGWPADLATSEALDVFCGNLRLFDSLMDVFKSHSVFNATPLVIAAAGNESRRAINNDYRISASLPASAEGVLSVAAAAYPNPLHTIADFSNSLPHLTAPGVNVMSAWPGGSLKSMGGTSMACPHVAGVAALWWEHLRDLRSSQLSQAVASNLVASARRDCFSPEFNASDFGHGLVSSPI